jgi:hypothetical protein
LNLKQASTIGKGAARKIKACSEKSTQNVSSRNALRDNILIFEEIFILCGKKYHFILIKILP